MQALNQFGFATCQAAQVYQLPRARPVLGQVVHRVADRLVVQGALIVRPHAVDEAGAGHAGGVPEELQRAIIDRVFEIHDFATSLVRLESPTDRPVRTLRAQVR